MPDAEQNSGEDAFYQLFSDYLNLENTVSADYPSQGYNLERMHPLAELVGHPEHRTKIIHVAGTKGKGTTSFYVSALFRSAGLRCGVFTSPHLYTVRERFLVNGHKVSYETLLEHGRDFVNRLEQAGMKPTFFEILTILALKIFAAEQCTYTVLETGIGGTLDATNFISPPSCAVITRISMDHTPLLGNSIRQIAEQKAGIVKPQTPVVLAPQRYPEATRIVHEKATKVDAPVYCVEACPETAQAWRLHATPRFLVENFCTALTVCNALGIKPDQSAFEVPTVPGRFEILREDPLLLIDAAHNADSAESLVSALLNRFPEKTFTIVLGAVAEKDAEGIMMALQRLPAEFIFTHPLAPPDKGSQLDRLCELARKYNLTWDQMPVISSLDDLPSQSNLVFTGSFFTALIGGQLLKPRTYANFKSCPNFHE